MHLFQDSFPFSFSHITQPVHLLIFSVVPLVDPFLSLFCYPSFGFFDIVLADTSILILFYNFLCQCFVKQTEFLNSSTAALIEFIIPIPPSLRGSVVNFGISGLIGHPRRSRRNSPLMTSSHSLTHSTGCRAW